ncbi:cytochrome P450 [Archangium lansingense]|uniref:cytochrome P450 n=1 Tax=Archangium lansingense TaxID=2995310 RepID=UPI003B826210
MASRSTQNLPPGPKGLPFLGSWLEDQADSIGMFHRYFKQYGDIVRFRLGEMPFHLVSHPQYVKHFLADNAANYQRPAGMPRGEKEGLFGLTGEKWKQHRRLLQPAFQRPRVEALVPKLVECTQRTLDQWWEPHARSGEPFRLSQVISRVMISQMSQAVYSEDASDEAFSATRNFLDFANNRRPVLVTAFFMALPFLDPRRPKRAEYLRVLWDLSAQHVARRRQGGEGPYDDLLASTMAARDDKGEGLTDTELAAEAFTLYFNGHEAPTSALEWTWLELSRHPEIEEQVRAVVERVLGDRPPALEDLPKLGYLTQVFQESMRLNPPAPVLTRVALAADRMGDYDVPAGTNVLAAPSVLHRHPAFWEEPDRFLPERFSPEQEKKIPRFLYVPFGAGQRLCIGNHMGLMQATLALAMMVQRYRVTPVPGARVVGAMGPSYHVKGGLKVRLAPARQVAPKARQQLAAG